MDITEFKKYALPNIEAGKIVDLIRSTIKKVQYSKQDAREKQKESLKPIIEKLEEEAKEISDLRKALEPKPPVPALPGPPPVPAIPGPPQLAALQAPTEQAGLPQSDDYEDAVDSEQPGPSTSTLDTDYKFSEEDLNFFRSKGLPTFKQVLDKSKTDESIFYKTRKETLDITDKLKGEKISLNYKIKKSKSPDETKKLNEDLQDINNQLKLNKKYRDRLDFLAEGDKMVIKKSKKGGRLSTPLRGSKGEYFPLLDRLELLSGSISAGNNSSKVKNEYSNIVHVLHKLNVINNDDAINLLSMIL